MVPNAKNWLFLGLPNPATPSSGFGRTDSVSSWNTDTLNPIDNLQYNSQYRDTALFGKKVTSANVRRLIRKVSWSSNTRYDMYRHDYSNANPAPNSNLSRLYDSNYYVINTDFRVYVCIDNGSSGDNLKGNPSKDEPTFTDLEPRSAGSSGDGYVWKYLYTIKPSDIVKFESTDFLPVPADWATSTDASSVRNNAVDGSLKIVTVTNRGTAIGNTATSYTNVPIKGNGSGAQCTVVVNNEYKIDSVTVTTQGSGYTYGSVDLTAGGVPTGTEIPTFDVIIPPEGGHGADIYRELGAYNVLLYSRIENDTENPDFITGNQIARVGVVENPRVTANSLLTADKASAVPALRLTGVGYSSATFTADTLIKQTIGTGQTAVGRVISYDSNTGVLKYWQDKSLAGFTTVGAAITNPTYGYELLQFTSTPSGTGNLTIVPDSGTNSNLGIDTVFSGISTVINNRTYNLGQSFVSGIAAPEAKKYSGNIIYVDNRPSITRSVNQKEDIKIILQF